MLYLYVRGDAPISADEQQSVLSRLGIVPEAVLVVDPPGSNRQLRRLLKILGDADSLAVATPLCFASSFHGTLTHIRSILNKGATVRVASNDLTVTPAMLPGILLADAIEQDLREFDAKMRQLDGKRGGRPTSLSDEMWAEAQRQWKDSNIPREAVAQHFGIGVSTLYRRFGPKG